MMTGTPNVVSADQRTGTLPACGSRPADIKMRCRSHVLTGSVTTVNRCRLQLAAATSSQRLHTVCRFIPETASSAATQLNSSTTEPVPPSCDDTVRDLQRRCLFRLLALPTAKAHGLDLPPLNFRHMGTIPPPTHPLQPQHHQGHSTGAGGIMLEASADTPPEVAQLQQDLSDFCSTYIPETITTTTANASPSTSPTTTPTTTAPTQAHLQSHQVALRLLVQCVVLGVSPSPSTVSRLWEALQPHLPVLPPEELVEVTWAMSALNRAPVRSMASELCSPTTDMLSWPLPRLARFACALAALHLGPPGVDPDPGVREWANNTVPQMFQAGWTWSAGNANRDLWALASCATALSLLDPSCAGVLAFSVFRACRAALGRGASEDLVLGLWAGSYLLPNGLGSAWGGSSEWGTLSAHQLRNLQMYCSGRMRTSPEDAVQLLATLHMLVSKQTHTTQAAEEGQGRVVGPVPLGVLYTLLDEAQEWDASHFSSSQDPETQALLRDAEAVMESMTLMYTGIGRGSKRPYSSVAVQSQSG